MKVVDPNDSSHEIALITRSEPVGALVLVLYNEKTQVSTTVANTYIVTDGVLFLTFTFTFVEDDKFQIKITEGAEIMYYGKLIATAQITQSYKLTNSRYTWN